MKTMKKVIPQRTTFATCLFLAAWALPLQAQQNPPLSRFNVKLGDIRAPAAPSEIPIISSGSWRYAPSGSFTADGKEFFFSNNLGNNHELYYATRANPSDPWGAVQPVGAPVNSPATEYSPMISGDGLALIWGDAFWPFTSQNPRPGGQGGGDLWMSTRTNRTSPWSAPINLGPQVNSAAHELLPRLTGDGLELFFIRDGDIYVSRRASLAAAWEAATPLPDYINLPYGNWFALPAPDGLTLMTGNIVSSSSSSPMDIFVSTRKDRSSPWNLPVSIGAAINDVWNQVGPGIFAPDGSALYFVHDDGNGVIGNGGVVKRVELLPLLEITVGYSSLFSSATLQSSANLGASWTTVTDTPAARNGQNQVVLPANNGAEFFRLVKP